MRVLLVTEDYWVGLRTGIGRHVEELAQALVEEDLEVTVIAPETSEDGHALGFGVVTPDSSSRYRPMSLPEQPFHLPRILHNNVALMQAALSSQARSEAQYDVVHAHDFFAAPAGVAIAASFEVPLVLTKHFMLLSASELMDQGRGDASLVHYFRGLERWSLESAHAVIAVSRHVLSCCVGVVPAVSQRGCVIVSGTRIDNVWRRSAPEFGRQRTTLRRRLGVRHDEEFVILQVGRLVPSKRPEVAIAALAQLRSRADAGACRLVFVGAGTATYTTSLRQFAQELGVAELVTFVGPEDNRDRLAMLYHAADAVVVPSIRESAGLVITEALTLGRLIIAADSGGVPEQVCHLRNGILFKHGVTTAESGDALAHAIEWALANPEHARRLATHGPLGGAHAFSWKRAANHTREVYLSVLAKAQARQPRHGIDEAYPLIADL